MQATSLKHFEGNEVCILASLAEEKIREDMCKMALLKTDSDETVCQKALLAGAKLKSEECGSGGTARATRY